MMMNVFGRSRKCNIYNRNYIKTLIYFLIKPLAGMIYTNSNINTPTICFLMYIIKKLHNNPNIIYIYKTVDNRIFHCPTKGLEYLASKGSLERIVIHNGLYKNTIILYWAIQDEHYNAR